MIHLTPETAKRRFPPASIGRTLFERMSDIARDRPAALTPSDYLQLRRKAARLSLAEAAAKLSDSAAATDVAQARGLLELLEMPGSSARRERTVSFLTRAFPFDPAVYAQLRDEPPERHPRICRGCGCSQNDACTSADGHEACGWAANTVCTRCAGDDA